MFPQMSVGRKVSGAQRESVSLSWVHPPSRPLPALGPHLQQAYERRILYNRTAFSQKFRIMPFRSGMQPRC